MTTRHFSDPYGTRQPALEQSLVKHRAYQMLLAIFYAEELKRQVLRLNYFPAGTKKMLDKSLQRLVDDHAITAAEKGEIVDLIDHRNNIAHQMHNLLVDLSPNAYTRDFAKFVPQHKHDAVARLAYFLGRVDKISASRITVLGFERFHFEFAERTLLSEIARLERNITKLFAIRSLALEGVNGEIRSLKANGFAGDLDPRHPLNRYDDGRLTHRGAEICYRLLDADKSPITVAHLLRISLVAARKRHRSWVALGGKARAKVEISALPKRRFYRRDDD